MPKYFKASTNVVGIPNKMVFVDKSGQGHLLPTLTPKKHTIASHYGVPAVLVDNKRGNLVKVIQKGEYTTDYIEEKIKKARVRKTAAEREQMKAEKEAKRAERERKKAEKEQKKAERDAKKAEKIAKKAEKDSKKAEKLKKQYKKNKPNLSNKLAASGMADSMLGEFVFCHIR